MRKLLLANDWTISSFDIYYAGQLSYTQFFREGFMENGRATDQGIGSYGVGDLWFFTDPSVKAGMTYHIDGRNRISYNMLGEYRAPLVNNAYVSPRIKDELIPFNSGKGNCHTTLRTNLCIQRLEDVYPLFKHMYMMPLRIWDITMMSIVHL
jgi:hypothetical protein